MTELTPERLAELVSHCDIRDGAPWIAVSPAELRELVDGYEDRAEQRESVHKLASLLQESHKRAQRYEAALRIISVGQSRGERAADIALKALEVSRE